MIDPSRTFAAEFERQFGPMLRNAGFEREPNGVYERNDDVGLDLIDVGIQGYRCSIGFSHDPFIRLAEQLYPGEQVRVPTLGKYLGPGGILPYAFTWSFQSDKRFAWAFEKIAAGFHGPVFPWFEALREPETYYRAVSPY